MRKTSTIRPLRSLHVAETIAGGVASYLEELVPMQIEAYGESNVRVIVPENQRHHLKRITQRAVRGFSAADSRMQNIYTMGAKLVEELRRFMPTVVNAHSTYAGFAVRPILRAYNPSGAKVLYYPHGWCFNRDSSAMATGLFRRVEHLWGAMTDSVVCTSKHEYDSAMEAGLPPQVLDMVYNGIASSAQRSAERPVWPDGPLRILFIGRLDRQKGIDLLIEAMRGLGERAFAYVIGEALVDAQPLPEIPQNMGFVGWQPREALEGYYATADLLVMPSRWEAFGITAIEAMRSGLPVVAASVGGLVEIVEHGVSGFRFPKNDAAALEEILATLDRGTLPAMGRAARARFEEHYSNERMFNGLERLYRKLAVV